MAGKEGGVRTCERNEIGKGASGWEIKATSGGGGAWTGVGNTVASGRNWTQQRLKITSGCAGCKGRRKWRQLCQDVVPAHQTWNKLLLMNTINSSELRQISVTPIDTISPARSTTQIHHLIHPLHQSGAELSIILSFSRLLSILMTFIISSKSLVLSHAIS